MVDHVSDLFRAIEIVRLENEALKAEVERLRARTPNPADLTAAIYALEWWVTDPATDYERTDLGAAERLRKTLEVQP